LKEEERDGDIRHKSPPFEAQASPAAAGKQKAVTTQARGDRPKSGQNAGVTRDREQRNGRLGFSDGGHGVGQGGEKFVVFSGVADGDADGFGETHPGEGTNDDTLLEKLVAERFGVRTDGDEEEIGFAGDGGEAESAEFEDEAAAFGAVHFDGAADVVGVIESGEGGSLAYAGDIEGSAELVHFGGEGGMADAVADAQSGKAVDFREGAEREDVVVLAEELHGVGEIGALGVFAVGFVEDDENVAGNFLEEGGEFGGTEGGARGVVGIGDIDDARLRGDGSSDGVKIESEILHAGLDELAATGANGDGEKCEGTFAGDALETGAQEDAGGEVDNFAGAQADENFLGADIVTRRKDFAKVLAAAIGIPVGFAECTAGGFHGLGRRAERVFVGSELNGMNLEILFDFFDGLAGNVSGEALDVVGD
jgi:hypothetical protein